MVVIMILNYIVTASVLVRYNSTQQIMKKGFLLNILNRHVATWSIPHGFVCWYLQFTIIITYLDCPGRVNILGIGLDGPALVGIHQGYFDGIVDGLTGPVSVYIRSRPVGESPSTTGPPTMEPQTTGAVRR
jgi:hypothetical protein